MLSGICRTNDWGTIGLLLLTYRYKVFLTYFQMHYLTLKWIHGWSPLNWFVAVRLILTFLWVANWCKQLHRNGNVFILMKLSSLAALEVVKVTTSSAASDENFVKMTTFLFQWMCYLWLYEFKVLLYSTCIMTLVWNFVLYWTWYSSIQSSAKPHHCKDSPLLLSLYIYGLHDVSGCCFKLYMNTLAHCSPVHHNSAVLRYWPIASCHGIL